LRSPRCGNSATRKLGAGEQNRLQQAAPTALFSNGKTRDTLLVSYEESGMDIARKKHLPSSSDIKVFLRIPKGLKTSLKKRIVLIAEMNP
jgi:hypothetical protein